MRTTITVDDELCGELMRLTKAESRNQAINQALAEWVRQQKIEKLRSLRGKLSFDGDLEELPIPRDSRP